MHTLAVLFEVDPNFPVPRSRRCLTMRHPSPPAPCHLFRLCVWQEHAILGQRSTSPLRRTAPGPATRSDHGHPGARDGGAGMLRARHARDDASQTRTRTNVQRRGARGGAQAGAREKIGMCFTRTHGDTPCVLPADARVGDG
jgi:hypothetical protein